MSNQHNNTEKKIICTFGLTPENINIIETELQELGSSRYTWEKIGKKIGWVPDEAAYWYIDYLLNKKETT